MAFKLEVLVEPKDDTYCGECSYLRTRIPYEQSTECLLFDALLNDWNLKQGYADPKRCDECIAAEQAAKEST